MTSGFSRLLLLLLPRAIQLIVVESASATAKICATSQAVAAVVVVRLIVDSSELPPIYVDVAAAAL